MATMTLNIQDVSIMPRLLEMLRGMKGVSVEKTEGYHCTNEPALSRKKANV